MEEEEEEVEDLLYTASSSSSPSNESEHRYNISRSIGLGQFLALPYLPSSRPSRDSNDFSSSRRSPGGSGVTRVTTAFRYGEEKEVGGGGTSTSTTRRGSEITPPPTPPPLRSADVS